MSQLGWLAHAACVLLLLLLLPWPAGAQSAPARGGTILLVIDSQAEALATRVSAELTALGFSVRRLSRDAERDAEPGQLGAQARAAGAFAAVGIGASAQGGVEITVLDRVTGKTVRRELLGSSLSDPTTRELVALRASELLRASLMEVEAPHAPRGEVPPSKTVREVAASPKTIRRPQRDLRLGAESGLLLAPGLTASPLLQVSMRIRVKGPLELGATLGGQLSTAERQETEGRMEALARWLSFGPQLRLLPRSEPYRVELGLHVRGAVVALSASGFAADANHAGRSDFVWSAAAITGIDSRVRIYGQLWWTLSPAAGFTAGKLALRADGRDVRVWGRPWLQCSTGLEVELP